MAKIKLEKSGQPTIRYDLYPSSQAPKPRIRVGNEYLPLTTDSRLSPSRPRLKLVKNGTTFYPRELTGVEKIRFTSNAWKTKNNRGTREARFYQGGTLRYKIGQGGDHYVCPTYGSKTWTVSSITDRLELLQCTSVTLDRYIDTSSDGGASIKIEFYYDHAWHTVLNTPHYRTGKGWRETNFGISV